MRRFLCAQKRKERCHIAWEWVNGEDERGKYRQLANLETGETRGERQYEQVVHVPDGKSVTISDPMRGKKATEKEPYFYRVYRANWDDIVRKKRLTMTERGVLVSLMTCLSWESNYLVHPDTGEILNQTQLAKVLRVDRPSLSDALDRLQSKGLVATVDRGNGREKAYQLNSHVLYYGRLIRDINEHKIFDDSAYEPVVRKNYRQRTQNL